MYISAQEIMCVCWASPTLHMAAVWICVSLEIDCAPLTIAINQNLSSTETPSSVWTEAEKLSLFLIMQDRMETPTQEVVYVIGLAF